MTVARDLARFARRASWEELSEEARRALKVRVLDALGCAIGAQAGPPVRAIRARVEEFGGHPVCTQIGGGRTSPDRAALYNGALVRYLDFNDSYLAPGETCHPSDNLGAVLAAAEYAGATGRDLLAALAVSYQVQCRLSDEAPVRARGFDHTTQMAFAAAAGAAKALGLDAETATNAIAIAGTTGIDLRVTRTGALSNWKGLAAPHTGFDALHSTFLAMGGVTGPGEVFEGNKGFMESVSGPFDIDWAREDLERVTRTILKRYNAEIHSQSALEGLLELRERHGFAGEDIETIELDIFDVAYDIIGGGEEGAKVTVRTKEEADHSLPYLLAVAVLDGQVLPEQYAPERIAGGDAQSLLRRVTVRPDDRLSERFPDQHACRLAVRLRDGRTLEADKTDYEGFHTRPMRWETVVAKFDRLSEPYAEAGLRREIVETVRELESARVSDLTSLLALAGDRARATGNVERSISHDQ
ncbi:MAG: MmgE/PrpD family protein [Actinomycetota bacterium]